MTNENASIERSQTSWRQQQVFAWFYNALSAFWKLVQRAELLNDLFAYLLRRQTAFFQVVSDQDLVHTNGAMRCVIVDVTTVQALVAKAAIAVTVARQLRDQLRRLARNAISIPRLAFEFFRFKRGCQTDSRWFCFVVSGN